MDRKAPMTSHARYSFELFPPRTPEGTAKLPAVIEKLAAFSPGFFSITHGAGGSGQNGTYETLLAVARHTGVETVPHLTCIGSSRESINSLLQCYREAGVKRIVALRGDLPVGTDSASVSSEFRYANELVSFIRATHRDTFQIEVAAYPEMHPQAASPSVDFENFRRKVEAGADRALTQLFYNAEAYFNFMERCGKAGIRIPVIPGIMPITSFDNAQPFFRFLRPEYPPLNTPAPTKPENRKAGFVDFGLEVVTRLCATLLKNGAPGLHFYTINQSEPTLRICENLALTETA